MERLAVNLVTRKAEVTYIGGRQYLVADATLIVPGVLPGSKGPLYYPPEEVRNSVLLWNGVPITNGHPNSPEGVPVSARSPDIIDKFGIGYVYNASFTDALKAKVYFDVQAVRRVNEKVLSALTEGKPFELSTGLYTRDEVAQSGATHNGREYTHTARDYKPDHLAILLDSKGACSIADGCGVFNALKISHGELHRQLMELLDSRFGRNSLGSQPVRYPYVHDVYDREVVFGLDDKTYRLKYTTDNRSGKVSLSEDDPEEVSRTVSYKVVRNEGNGDFDSTLTTNPKGAWTPPEAGDAPEEIKKILKAVYSKFRDEHPAEDAATKEKGAKMAWGAVHKAGWEKDKSGKWHKKSVTGNSEGGATTMPLTQEQKQEVVTFLTTNCGCWKGEKAVETLNNMPDEQLVGLKAHAEEEMDRRKLLKEVGTTLGISGDLATNQMSEEMMKKCKEMMAKDKGGMSSNTTKETPTTPPLTEAEWLRSAPTAIVNRLKMVEDMEKKHRNDIIVRLVANFKDDAGRTKAYGVYATMTTDQLETLATHLPGTPAPTPDPYPGLPPRYDALPAHNHSTFDENDTLEIMSVDYQELSPVGNRKR